MLYAINLALVGSVVVSFAQAPFALSSLTVPASSLPGGCVLKPVGSKSEPFVQNEFVQSFPSNPWSGADRRLRTAVLNAVDSVPQMPDAPPDRRENAAMMSRRTDDVAEAYHAEYASASGAVITVSAVRFVDAALATPAPLPGTPGPRRGAASRLVNGATVIEISSGAQNECFRAIEKYVRSAK